MNIDPKTDLIAIRFKGGTGGKFLNSLLTTAKLKIKNYTLSDLGNTHSSYREIPDVLINPISDSLNRNKINSIESTSISYPPYFMNTHWLNIKELLSEVYKVITITYDIDDVETIFHIYVGKNSLDTDSKDTLLTNQILTSLYIETLNNRLKYNAPNTNRSLCISFKELLYGDNLISTLSKFTGIEEQDFDIDFLEDWRQKTLMGIKKTKEYLDNISYKIPEL